MNHEAIVIGVSAGGMKALGTILPHLPADFALGIIVVQHLHPSAEDSLALRLNKSCELAVKQADEKESIAPGVIYIAPPDYHLMVEEDRAFSLSLDEPVNYARPSIDILFETAADAYGSKLVGIVLTGANADGSHGLKRIKESGGVTIVQDPATAEIETMPRAAIAATQVDHILPLEEIGPFLVTLANRREA
jgi:two-component system chemotaxis response regulator CheB